MKTKSSPSRYRYCISRLSTLATSTRTPALNVRSTTLPDSTFFSLVRTKAPPLPGLTCWNSTTVQSAPSMLSVMPFLRSFVVATSCLPRASGTAVPPSQHEQFLGGRDERFRPGRADHEGVLDPDAALAGHVNPRLDSDRNPVFEFTCPARSEHRRFVHLQPDAVTEAMPEMVAVTSRSDHRARCGIDVSDIGTLNGCRDPSQLCRRHQVIDLPLPGRGRAECYGPRHVRVISGMPCAAVNSDQVAALKHAAAGRMVRYRTVRPAGDDGAERGRLGAEIDHRPLYQDCELPLGAARPDRIEHGSERLVRQRARPRQQLDLGLVLDRAQVLHDVAEWHQLRDVRQRCHDRVLLNCQLVRLECQRAPATPGSQAGQGRLELPLNLDLEVRTIPVGTLRVPEVGAEQSRPVGWQEHGHIRADQAGQVANVRRDGDQRAVGARFGDPLLRERAAGGMNL